MRVLLSIKPEFAQKIFSGDKKYEFRRTVFKNPNVKTVIVYASSPTQKVIGEFEIDVILNAKLKPLWEKTKRYAGITKSHFFDYFSNKEIGFAIRIKSVKKYRKELNLKEKYNIVPPQSFIYLDPVSINR